jgi:hypothetical protein
VRWVNGSGLLSKMSKILIPSHIAEWVMILLVNDSSASMNNTSITNHRDIRAVSPSVVIHEISLKRSLRGPSLVGSWTRGCGEGGMH